MAFLFGYPSKQWSVASLVFMNSKGINTCNIYINLQFYKGQWIEWIIVTISIIMSSLSAGSLGFIWFKEPSQQVLYTDNPEHVIVLIFSIILCIIFGFKFIYEIVKEPDSWKVFMFIYCFIVLVLIGYQFYVTAKESMSHHTSGFNKPSQAMLISSLVFCLIQFMINFIWQMFVSQKTPHLHRETNNAGFAPSAPSAPSAEAQNLVSV